MPKIDFAYAVSTALELAMTETTSKKTLVQKLGRLLRFIAFLATAGWAYPHVCTEDMDLTKLQNDQSRGVQ